MPYALWSLASSSQKSIDEVHPCYRQKLSFILFHCNLVFCCEYITIFKCITKLMLDNWITCNWWLL